MVRYKLSKNDWVTPFFVIFRSVREKLLVTVSFDHPVVSDFRKSTTQVVSDVGFSSIPREKEEAFAKLRPTSRSPLEHQSYLYCPSVTEMFET